MNKNIRVMAVFTILVLSLWVQQSENKEVKAQTTIEGATLNVQQDKNQKKAIRSYIKQVFGACKADATHYLTVTNRLYNPHQVLNNYGVDQYVISNKFIGLFGINDSLPETQHYTLDQLLDYKMNTDIAYKLFVENNYSFDGFTCYNK